MSTVVVASALARIAALNPAPLTGRIDLEAEGLELRCIDRAGWSTGDYVVGRVRADSTPILKLELTTGRMAAPSPGTLLLGALGHRAATLEVVGSWRDVREDGVLEILTAGGLLGRSTSRSDLAPELIQLDYEGHLTRGSDPVRMRDQVQGPASSATFQFPTVLVIGSSMSAGKTTTAAIVIRLLRSLGKRVLGAKLTGAGRFRDVLALADAGADWIYDFVDAGLPSTVVPAADYRAAITGLLSHMASLPADVAVIEAGASPLEPYNGDVAMEFLAPMTRCLIMCASDPYAVVGLASAFDRQPDLIAGPTANTEAGIALVKKLTGVTALDPRTLASRPVLLGLLQEKLGLTADS